MPQLTIYVDRDLATRIRDHRVKVSETCQAALRRKVRLAERRAAAGIVPTGDSDGRPLPDPPLTFGA